MPSGFVVKTALNTWSEFPIDFGARILPPQRVLIGPVPRDRIRSSRRGLHRNNGMDAVNQKDSYQKTQQNL